MDHALDGRRMSRNVLGDLASRWAAIWDEALAIQSRNPDMLKPALSKTTDPESAIIDIIPHLALLHPRVTASVAAFCHGVADELDYDPPGDPVAPTAHTPVVESERDGGGGQQQDRAVELQERVDRLEQWHADLEDEVVRLRRIIADAGVQASRPTNTA